MEERLTTSCERPNEGGYLRVVYAGGTRYVSDARMALPRLLARLLRIVQSVIEYGE